MNYSVISLDLKYKRDYYEFMNKFYLSFLMFICLITITSCKKQIYEISMDDSSFNLAIEKKIFNGKKTLHKYPKNKAFEIYKKNDIRIQIISDSINSPYKKAINLGNIQKKCSLSQVDDIYHNIQINKEPLFVCKPFNENLNEYHSIPQIPQGLLKKIDIPELYTLNEIPKNYIALPIKKDEKIYYADDFEYPLTKTSYLSFSYNDENIKTAKDKQAMNYAKKTLPSKFLSLKKGTPKTEVIFTCAVGDMMLARGVDDLLYSTKTAKSVFTNTFDILQNNDFTIGNLECVITDKDLKTPKTYNFKVSNKILDYLKQTGFDYLMMTNNHCYDYGEEGFKDTLTAVRNYNIATSGVGFNYSEANKFYNTTIKNQKIAVISCGAYPIERSDFNGKTMATATENRAGILWESKELISMIKEQKQNGNFVIINCHAGVEYSTKQDASQIELYKKFCDAGADIIFGSHPHVLQPIEMYNNSLIVYSLGNFIFNGMENMPNATDTMIIKVGIINNKIVYYKKYPCRINETRVFMR